MNVVTYSELACREGGILLLLSITTTMMMMMYEFINFCKPVFHIYKLIFVLVALVISGTCMLGT